MAIEGKKPQDLVERIARRRSARAGRDRDRPTCGGARPSACRGAEAREKAREWFDRYPKAAYMTEIEYWRELADGQIEFVMRRLPAAD